MSLDLRVGWIGVDEAGRGPLAGPVVAAAVLIPDQFDIGGIRDSKMMSSHDREAQFARITEHCPHAVALSDVEEIDRINILQATFTAMRRAIADINCEYEGILVDGNQTIYNAPASCEPVIKGDGKYAQIAAASILAKTYRDRLMSVHHQQFPEYGFDKHFGYATPEHLTALREYGPCELHRKSFSPIKEMLLQPCLILEK
ncbi:MAG: ribonuclease HII [Fimbriimonadales bacterium]